MLHKQNVTLHQIYKISFLSFYIIPVITILCKLIFGLYSETLMEVWFLGLLLIITVVILLLPKITKQNKERLIYLLVSVIIFFFGLGAIGFKTTYIIADFSEIELLFKIPYIIMFIILVMQLVCILVLSYYYKSKTKLRDISINIKMNKTLYLMMGIMVVLGYLVSIIVKLILHIEFKYVGFEISFLLGYVILYIGFLLLSKFQFKQNVKEGLFNALFFIPIMSIGFAIVILFFKESFVLFKLTTLICGAVNFVLYLMNLYMLSKEKISSDSVK